MLNFLVQHALESSLVAAGVGLAAAFGLILWIRKQSDGNERMREVAAAIQEGAAAYLNRQLQAISLIALILFGAIVWLKNLPTGVGFVVGAACSLAAGFFGMRIAVMANVRTAEAASRGRTAALRAAFNGGAVTGLLVVATPRPPMSAPTSSAKSSPSWKRMTPATPPPSPTMWGTMSGTAPAWPPMSLKPMPSV